MSRHFDRSAEWRDLAWYDPNDHTIYVVDRLRHFGIGTRLGILRHELGHAADAHLSQRGAERRADAIAERVTGSPIRYDRHDVQNAHRGTVGRPAHLPK